MKKLTLRFIIAIFTFIIGITAASFWLLSHREPSRKPVPSDIASETQISPRWVYINRDIDWESPPKQIEQTFQASLNSTIIIFYPSGKFASVGCTLYRDNKSKRMSISAGDDFSVSKGTWKRNDNESITATSHVTHGMTRNSPVQVEKWLIREHYIDRMAGVLELNGYIYIPIQSVGNFAQLSPMIADDNQ